jgi:hypothetical protein
MGRALLAGSTTMVVGCFDGSTPVGNLVPPPMVELCVTPDPPSAVVEIDGVALEADGCNQVMIGGHSITATAPGYLPFQKTLSVGSDTQHSITLTPESPAV